MTSQESSMGEYLVERLRKRDLTRSSGDGEDIHLFRECRAAIERLTRDLKFASVHAKDYASRALAAEEQLKKAVEAETERCARIAENYSFSAENCLQGIASSIRSMEDDSGKA